MSAAGADARQAGDVGVHNRGAPTKQMLPRRRFPKRVNDPAGSQPEIRLCAPFEIRGRHISGEQRCPQINVSRPIRVVPTSLV